MVSLINFKSVSDELQQQQQRFRLTVTCATSDPANSRKSFHCAINNNNNNNNNEISNNSSNKISDNSRQNVDSSGVSQQQQQQPQPQAGEQQQFRQPTQETIISSSSSGDGGGGSAGQQHQESPRSGNRMMQQNLQQVQLCSLGDAPSRANCSGGNNLKAAPGDATAGGGGGGGGCGQLAIISSQFEGERRSAVVMRPPPCCGQSATDFVVTWRNLRFAIEPKWHQRLASSASLSLAAFKQRESRQKPAAATAAAIESGAAAANLACQPTAAAAAEAGNCNPQLQLQLQLQLQQTNGGRPETKVVLDLLDGSFKSGELTAILGPSGAGKTTLLDCLTGHRKHGLSGSIRISSTLASSCCCCACSYCCSAPAPQHNNNNNCPEKRPDVGAGNFSTSKVCSYGPDSSSQLAAAAAGHHRYSKNSYSKQKQQQQHYHHSSHNHHNQHPIQQQPQSQQQHGAASGDNLKVSIIPQNDHLMGHLTVYETLNYASKMKNCFDRQFDHKLNIKRVAQQLGLMSCLGTRINKLSGGQYKRVSIAQELLSSPDILILDEPTSGLDAMTCYQTVQVLRKLTDDRQLNGQNPIAVILTIHQPNSDVFQQFNHVYVVAQGGKCIYEGPPSSIESVINRVGIRLPNSYYNPATMIVEIAAGKFGNEAIQKLNEIQKKQYDCLLADEQHSTGDSAVDCPSTSASSASSASSSTAASQDEDDEHDRDNYGKPDKRSSIVEINNNSSSSGGLINEGFIGSLDGGEQTIKSNRQEIISVVVRAHEHEPAAIRLSGELVDTAAGAGDTRQQRKKRRRTRKRSTDLPLGGGGGGATPTDPAALLCARFPMGGGGGGGGGGDGSSSSSSAVAAAAAREKRLKLNSLKADQKFPFWRHTYLHFHRSWLSIVRDPMLCSMQLALHIIVPVMVSLVYGTNVGKPNACPRAGPMDIMAYALEPTDSALQLQEDLRTTLENIGYIFFKLYGIIFAAMTVTVLTFPLDMHVLVKEFRNGWYGLSSYFLGRTLADIPFQLTLPLLAMSLSYYATGQPYSYMQWRFLSITGILILSSLIAQSQGLLFGAILMDRMKAAVFVAPAATTPIILFAGFLVRTQSIPHYLRPLSNLSYLRYAIEACLISRYGFNQCECDPAVFNQTVPELPPIARSMLDYWLSSFKTSQAESSALLAPTNGSSSLDGGQLETTTVAGAAAAESANNPDLFTKLIDSLGKANSFGRNITSCEQVVPYPMIDYDLKDSQLFNCFAILIFMLVFTRLLTFFIVCFKVKRKV